MDVTRLPDKDVTYTRVEFEIPALRGGAPDIVAADASVSHFPSVAAYAAVYGDGQVRAGWIDELPYVGKMRTETVEAHAARIALSRYDNESVAWLVTDCGLVERMVTQVSSRGTPHRSQRQRAAQTAAVPAVVDALYNHLMRLNVHATLDKKQAVNQAANHPQLLMAHRIAYALMRIRLDGITYDREVKWWLREWAADPSHRKHKIKATYDRWAEELS